MRELKEYIEAIPALRFDLHRYAESAARSGEFKYTNELIQMILTAADATDDDKQNIYSRVAAGAAYAGNTKYAEQYLALCSEKLHGS